MRLFLIVLSLLGLADSLFLVGDALLPGESCGVLLAKFGIASCGVVTTSVYGTVWGFPISLLGIIAYGTLVWLGFKGFATAHYRKGLLVLTSGGLLFSAYLTYLQWQVLDAWCFFCLVSASIMSLCFLTALALFGSVQRTTRKLHGDLRTSLKVFIMLLVVVVLSFESLRGRMLYRQTQQDLAKDEIEVSLPAQPVGVIGQNLVMLHELDSLAGAAVPAYRQAAFDYRLLGVETELSSRSLEELIHEQTTLYLYAPNNDTQPLAQLAAQAATSAATQEFLAYLEFLTRAQAKGKHELWELYVTELKTKHEAQLALQP